MNSPIPYQYQSQSQHLYSNSIRSQVRHHLTKTHIVKSVTVDSFTEREDQVRTRSIHGITGDDHLTTRSQNIGQLTRRAWGNFVDSKDRSDVDSGINVGAVGVKRDICI